MVSLTIHILVINTQELNKYANSKGILYLRLSMDLKGFQVLVWVTNIFIKPFREILPDFQTLYVYTCIFGNYL